MELAAGIERVRLGDVGESKQQSLPMCIRRRAARKCLYRKPARLSELNQFNVADVGAEPRDEVHPARLEIDGDPIAKHLGQTIRQYPAARRIERRHAFEMAREVTDGHEFGNHALL